ncbi:hypothetical protein SuNHUV7_40880 (plasmid) [Pseudoseohaeicola sp. NH-UV-7]
MVICRPVPHLQHELLSSNDCPGFSGPDLIDHFAHSGRRLLTPLYRLQAVTFRIVSRNGSPCRISVILLLCQHGPDCPRHLVGQRSVAVLAETGSHLSDNTISLTVLAETGSNLSDTTFYSSEKNGMPCACGLVYSVVTSSGSELSSSPSRLLSSAMASSVRSSTSCGA